ncbi:hypothetical protein TEA_024947 [Camellia sinensis var. sinensis]|uniref:K-box domain-containing protein n=1 Tax=Camellia sinensis var. sinensis TaxID=542762 RepID=A0A4S4DXL4_CAMSN|nr:hypothetical protein TEA_024947 [Camellia sinensis var. sinensis]
MEVSKAISPTQMLSKTFSGRLQDCGNGGGEANPKDIVGEVEKAATVSSNPFLFASSETTQYIMEPIMSQFETIQRYQRHTKDVQTDNSSVEENMQHLKHEAADMAKQIELLEVAKRKLLGEDLGSCTMEELQQIEQQLERSVSRVRAKKMEAFMEQVDQLKEKEKVLTAENAKLCEKYGLLPRQESNEEREVVPYTESSEISDVETDLFIGPPEGRIKRASPQK